RQWLAASGPAPEVKKSRLEAFSNLLLPLVRAAVLYAVALVLLGVAWRTGSATVSRSALMLVLLASALHAAGLVFATMLAGPSSCSSSAVNQGRQRVRPWRRTRHSRVPSHELSARSRRNRYVIKPSRSLPGAPCAARRAAPSRGSRLLPASLPGASVRACSRA